MNIFALWWRKICEPLDGFLWQKDISHPIIRPLLRNEILASGFCVLLGAALYVVLPSLFWFGSGLVCMAWIFWSWARFFLKFPLDSYNAAFLRATIFNFGLRLIILAILLYFALAICHASPGGIIVGLITGAILGLASYAFALRRVN